MKNFQINFKLVFILFLFVVFLALGISFKAYANNYEQEFNKLKIYQTQMRNAIDKKNWEELKRISEIVIKSYPKLDSGYFGKGIALDELGYYEEAIQNYNIVEKIRPTSGIYQNRGYTYLKMKEYDKAIAEYDKALEINKSSELALEQRETAINAKKGISITIQGNMINYESIHDPFYLANEYSNLPEILKLKYKNAVTNYEGSVLPIYYITVAEEVYQTNKDYAAFLYTAGRFRSMQDVLMCKDTSATQAIMLMPFVAPNTVQYISKMKKKELAQLLQKVIDWDEQYPDRPDPKWICYHGINVFTNNNEVETYPQSKFETIKKETKNALLEKIKKYAK